MCPFSTTEVPLLSVIPFCLLHEKTHLKMLRIPQTYNMLPLVAIEHQRSWLELSGGHHCGRKHEI